MKNIKYLFLAFAAFAIVSCDPFVDEAPVLPDLPAAPQFTVEPIDTNNNYRVEIINPQDYFNTLLTCSTGSFRNPFSRLDKTTSDKTVDTIQFLNAGIQVIFAHGLHPEGGGNAVSQIEVDVPKDLGAQCTDILELLLGDCTSSEGKCWTWIQQPAELIVGPDPGSGEWFSSNGLQYEQYDDQFCFIFEGSQYIYDNYGASVFPFDGSFSPMEYEVPAWSFILLEDEEIYDAPHTLILNPNETVTDKPWMGTWDSGPVYGIVSITEDELIVRSAITDIDGAIGDGYFDFVFVPSE